MKPYRHPKGYRYYQSSVTVNGTRIRPTISEHQLVFLMHEQCDDPRCDCGCHPDCDLGCEFACPYKIFSNGKWEIHHGQVDGETVVDDDIPGVPDKWANWGSNLVIMDERDHGEETYSQTGPVGSAKEAVSD